MGVFDDVQVTPASPGIAGKGVFSSVAAPAATAAPASGGVFANVSVTPAAASVAAPAAPSPYFQGKEPSGAFVGISDEKDPYSGKPYLAYRLPGADSTTTDMTRIAPAKNPELAAPQPKTDFENPRMPESASQAVRANEGATSDEQLDHRMALALGGSNDLSNLKLIPTKDNQAASKLEGQLPSQIAAGDTSLFDAQAQEAAAKGLATPWTDQKTGKGLLDTIQDIEDKTGITSLTNWFKGIAQPTVESIQGAGNAFGSAIADVKQSPGDVTKWTGDALSGIANSIGAIVSAGSSGFSAASDLASKVPVLKQANDGVNWLIGKGGDVAGGGVQAAINALPISDEAKQDIGAPLAQLGSLAGQLIAGGLIFHELGRAVDAKTNGAGVKGYVASLGDLQKEDFKNVASRVQNALKPLTKRLPTLLEAQRGFVRIPGLGDLPEEGDKTVPPANEEENKQKKNNLPAIIPVDEKQLKTGNFISDNTQEQTTGGGIATGHFNIAKQDENGKFVSTPATEEYYRQTPFEGVPKDILQKIKEGGGSPLNPSDLKRLGDSLTEHGYTSANTGLVVKGYGSGRDIVLGTTKVDGQIEYIVAGMNRDGTLDTVRLHGTPIGNSQILGHINAEDFQKMVEGKKTPVTDTAKTEEKAPATKEPLQPNGAGKPKAQPRTGTSADFTDVLQKIKQGGLSLSNFLNKSDKIYNAHDPETRAALVDVYKNLFKNKTPITDEEVAQASHIFEVQSKSREYARGARAAGSGLSKDTLANAGNFYAQMDEMTKADPDRSLNDRKVITSYDLEQANERAKERMAKEQAKQAAIVKSRSELPPGKRGVIERIKDALKPIARLPEETKAIAKAWHGSLLEAVEKGNKEMAKVPATLDKKLPTDEAVRDYTAIQHGAYTEARPIFNKLFDHAERSGLDVPYRKNYLPQVYKEPLGEVKSSLVQYLRDKGVDEETAQAYVEKVMQLPESTALHLKISPSFEEAKAFPDYGVAAKYGLSPKFTNMKELIGNYSYELERSIANKKFVDTLVDKGKLLEGAIAPKHWEHVTTNFVQGDLYAEPKLADLINGLYDEPSLFAQAVKPFQWVSSKMQHLVLSGGIPYTDIHFWTIGNMIKSATALRFQDIIPVIRANSLEADAKYFRNNQSYVDMAARQGIDLGGRMGSIKKIFTEASKDDTFMQNLGVQFNKAFSDKTFGTLMPELYLSTFKEAHIKAMENGANPEEAEKFAGDVTKNWFGLLETEGRSAGVKGALTTAFIAPNYRESVLGVIANTVKSVTTERSNPAFYLNRRLAAGMFVSFGMYQVFNKMLTGNYTWQNPDGHQFDLMIPLPDGNNIYVPFMPSFMTLPRAAAGTGLALAKGDIATAEQQTGNLFSIPVQVGVQLLANRDYFGNEIYKPTDSGLVKAEKVAAYVGLDNSHPYVKAVTDLIQKHIPVYQALSEALTLPLKFSTNTQIAENAFYNAMDAQTQTNATGSATIAPIYAHVQQLAASGDKAGAQKIVDSLTDAQYKAYTDYKRAQTAKQTTQTESSEYATYQQVQGLVQEGNTAQAKQIVDGMTDAQYHAYTLLKKRFGAAN